MKKGALRGVLLLGLLPLVAFSMFGAQEDATALGLDSTYDEHADKCEPPTSDCVIITVPAPDDTQFATCSFIASHSESYLSQYGSRWVATDAPCS